MDTLQADQFFQRPVLFVTLSQKCFYPRSGIFANQSICGSPERFSAPPLLLVKVREREESAAWKHTNLAASPNPPLAQLVSVITIALICGSIIGQASRRHLLLHHDEFLRLRWRKYGVLVI